MWIRFVYMIFSNFISIFFFFIIILCGCILIITILFFSYQEKSYENVNHMSFVLNLSFHYIA